MPDTAELDGFTVGVTADRRGEDQALMFRRLGAEVIHGPTIRTRHDDADHDRLREATEALIAEPPDYLVANTGLGVRTWMALARSWGLDGKLVAALSATRVAARGPKAAGAVRAAGLELWWRAPTERLDAVADHLLAQGVAGARVAYQRHGDDHQRLTEALTAAGAAVVELPVYRWAIPDAEDAAPAMALIERCCAGEVDAVTFTAGPQVRNLLALAETAGRAEALLEAFNRQALVACIGPVCAAVASEEGIVDPLVPEHWRLGSLVRAVADELVARRGGRQAR